MAFNSQKPRVEYVSTTGQTTFTFLFKVFNTTDLVVYQTLEGIPPDDTTDKLVLTTDYTVTIDGDSGGTIVLNTATTGADSITILRELPQVREYDYQTNGDLRADTLNDDQDYQTYLIADNQASSDRVLTLSQNSQGVSNVMPTPIDDSYLRWSADGSQIINDITIPDAVQTAVDAADASGVSATASANSATDSEESALLSETHKNLSRDWAEKDTEVIPGSDSSKTWAARAANSAATVAGNNVITNGAIQSGVLAMSTTEVTGSIPILYTGNGTSQDIPTPMQIANDNGDGTTLAADWSDTTYSLGDIVIDNSTTGDARAYRCIVAIDSATGVSPVLDTTNWVLETNQYGGRFWFKGRSGATSNIDFDSICRESNYIVTDTTAIEVNDTTSLTAINVNSLSIGSFASINTDIDTHVVWVDQTTRKTAGYRTDAGVIQNSKNNTGTDLMAKDSAGNPIIEHYNPSTGFSIIMDTGNGVAGRSIPHSLQKKESFHVRKGLTGDVYYWASYDKVKGAKWYMSLDSTAAAAAHISIWNDTEPTDNNFTVGTGLQVNANGNQYISYLQADSPNHVIKSYTGTGAAGNVVDLGLDMTVAGSYVMIKRLDDAGSWAIHDTLRGYGRLLADAALVEDSTNHVDFTPTGVIINTAHAEWNATNGLYLIQAYSPTYNQPTGGSDITVNGDIDLTFSGGVGVTNTQETTTTHSVDLSSFAGGTAYLLKERGNDVIGDAEGLAVGQTRPSGHTGYYLNTLDKLVYNSTDDAVQVVALGECKVDTQGNVI